MTIFPKIFAELTVWVFVFTNTVTNIVWELAFVDLSIFPSKLTPSVLYIIIIISFKYISIIWSPCSFSLSFSSSKLSLINTSIFPFIYTWAMKFTIKKLPFIDVKVNKLLHSESVFKSFFHITFIIKTISIKYYCFSRLLSLIELADILVIFLINQFSFSMWFTIHPFSIIRHKLWRVINNFDTTLTTSISIPKLS